MQNIESKIQQACVRWFRLQYPKYAGNLFSVPNGGYRNAVRFQKAVEAEGYRYALCYSVEEFINLVKGYLQFKD